MNQIVTQIDAGIATLIGALIAIAVKGLAYKANEAVGHLKTFVNAHTTEQERNIVKSLVQDSVPYVQANFPGITPQELVQKATDHVIALAINKGINVDETEIKAAVSALHSVIA